VSRGPAFRVGTRSSAMALAQTEEVVRRLKSAWSDLPFEVVRFKPAGDRDQVGLLDRHGGKGGAFVAEIRAAMLAGDVEAAMHSLKDMPGDQEAQGLVIAAYLKREAAADALVLRPGLDAHAALSSRAAGLKIGTNSVRRAASLKRLYPEAEIIHFRGAADTRVKKLDEGAPQRLPEGGEVGPADALVLAKAGLERVGLSSRIVHEFTVEEMLPAVGQGIVAVECPERAFETRRRLAALDDQDARCAALAEREVLWLLNGHCNSPIAGHATIAEGTLRLAAAVMSLDGREMIASERTGPIERPRELGRAVGFDILAKGAARLIEAARS